GDEAVALRVMLYLKLSGSRLSSRPLPVSPCGYMKKGSVPRVEPGSATSCAVLNATQFISQEPNSRSRAALTRSSLTPGLPGGSSSATLRTSAGSTGTHPNPVRYTSARQCCARVALAEGRPRLRNAVAGATRRP